MPRRDFRISPFLISQSVSLLAESPEPALLFPDSAIYYVVHYAQNQLFRPHSAMYLWRTSSRWVARRAKIGHHQLKENY